MPSEFTLIERHFTRPTRQTVLGVGDDGAIVRPAPGMELVISTDMLVAGTHFLPDTDPTALGWKTLAVNLSDMAAMGAQPRWALLAMAIPDANEDWISRFSEGFFTCAATYGVDLIGGDTTRGPMNICITIFGEVASGQALLRTGAKPGDEIWVSGTPGCAALGLSHLQGHCVLPDPAREACLEALLRPQPRIELGVTLAQRRLATAAIDISDGLLADLGHILEKSRVAATLHLSRFPDIALRHGAHVAPQHARRSLLSGGDDYELIFTAPTHHHDEIASLHGTPLACIGQITHGQPGDLRLLDDTGQLINCPQHGYDHFA